MEMSKHCDYCDQLEINMNTLSCKHQVCYKCIYKLYIFNYDTLLFSFKEGVTLSCLKCQMGEMKTTRKEINKICSLKNLSDNDKNPLWQVHKKEDLLFKENWTLMGFDKFIDSSSFSCQQSIKQTDHTDKQNLTKHSNSIENQSDQHLSEEIIITHHKENNNELIKDVYRKKRKDILNNIKLPFKSFEDCERYLAKEDNMIREAIHKQSKFLVDQIDSIIDSLNITKDDVMSQVKQLEEKMSINYEISRTIYDKLFQELDNLSSEDYFNIDLLSNLPKIHYVPKLNENFNEYSVKRLKEIEVTISILNSEKDSHIKLETKKILLNYSDIANVSTLKEHTGRITCLAQLKDGMLASSSADNTIKIWNIKKNTCTTLIGHINVVSCLMVLKDGKLASGSADSSIRIWDPKKGYQCTRTLTGHNGRVSSLILLEDGKLASASEDSSIIVWHLHNNRCKRLIGHNKSVRRLIQLKDGKLASCSDDETVRIWNLKDNRCMILTGHTGPVSCLVELKDGKIASGSWDETIRIWDPENNFSTTESLTGHTDGIVCLIQLEDGKLISSSDDTTIRVWDPTKNFKCIKTLTKHSSLVRCLLQLKDGVLISASDDETIRLWDLENGYNCFKVLNEHTSAVLCLTQLEDGKLVSGSKDNNVVIWDKNLKKYYK